MMAYTPLATCNICGDDTRGGHLAYLDTAGEILLVHADCAIDLLQDKLADARTELEQLRAIVDSAKNTTRTS